MNEDKFFWNLHLNKNGELVFATCWASMQVSKIVLDEDGKFRVDDYQLAKELK